MPRDHDDGDYYCSCLFMIKTDSFRSIMYRNKEGRCKPIAARILSTGCRQIREDLKEYVIENHFKLKCIYGLLKILQEHCPCLPSSPITLIRKRYYKGARHKCCHCKHKSDIGVENMLKTSGFSKLTKM